MNRTALHWLGQTLVVVAATLSTACVDDAPLGPSASLALPAPEIVQMDAVASDVASPATMYRAADLDACDNLRVPTGSRLAFRVYASGVQIYRWNGTNWIFIAPSALLFADAAGKGVVGTHYAGPTWESVSGGKLVGTVLERCTPDPDAIAWLLLGATSEGPGIFQGVTFIQRVNTVGGNAPADPGSQPGDEAHVPYTTEYLFYRTQ